MKLNSLLFGTLLCVGLGTGCLENQQATINSEALKLQISDSEESTGPLSAQATVASVDVGQEFEILVSGGAQAQAGSPRYTFAVVAGVGRTNPNKPNEIWVGPSPGTVTVRVTDSDNMSVDVSVSVQQTQAILNGTPVFPNDFLYNEQIQLHNTGNFLGTAVTPDVDINAPEANRFNTECGMVFVLDSGVQTDHPDLAENIWVNPGEIAGNGIDDDQNGYVDDVNGYDLVNSDNNPYDDNFHGTYVASLVGAVGNNNNLISGICWEADIVPVKVLGPDGSGSFADILDGIDYMAAVKAAQNLDVAIAVHSYGGVLMENSPTVAAIANKFNQSGMLHFVAAGNDGVDNDVVNTVPLGNGSFATGRTYPAALTYSATAGTPTAPNVITVAGTDAYDSLGRLETDSNFGFGSVQEAAPFWGIGLTPTTETLYMNQNSIPEIATGQGGTSYSAPLVAGIAALYLDFMKGTGIDAQGVMNRILTQASPNSQLSGFVGTGGEAKADLVMDPNL